MHVRELSSRSSQIFRSCSSSSPTSREACCARVCYLPLSHLWLEMGCHWHGNELEGRRSLGYRQKCTTAGRRSKGCRASTRINVVRRATIDSRRANLVAAQHWPILLPAAADGCGSVTAKYYPWPLLMRRRFVRSSSRVVALWGRRGLPFRGRTWTVRARGMWVVIGMVHVVVWGGIISRAARVQQAGHTPWSILPRPAAERPVGDRAAQRQPSLGLGWEPRLRMHFSIT